MTTRDILHETFSALTSNKIRTFLTMLGIIIGISSVIILVAVGQGAKGTIETNIQSLGSNLLIIFPGAQRQPGYQVSTGRGQSRSLTPEDASAIRENVSNVAAVSPELAGRYQITAKGSNTNTSVTGVTESYASVHNVGVAEGRFITENDVKSANKVAVIGPTTRDDLFGEGANAISQTIRMQGLQFTVIGVTTSKGTSGFNNQDDAVYIPLSSAQRYLVGDSSYVSNIGISASSPEVMTVVQDEITNLLLQRHHVSDPELADFSVLNQSSIVSAASSVTNTLTTLLAAVAGISLVVGGIGIMNMMLTTVTERTGEIGLRKAIGARRSDIIKQFLGEAIALTIIGGGIGIGLGWLASYVIQKTGLLQTSVSGSSVLLAFSVSALIGIIFGFYPAYRASRLNPIEALRYE